MKDDVYSLIQAWPCCSVASVKVTDLPARERLFFEGLMPKAITAIAVAHHIVKEEEWTWYASGISEEHCEADDHVRDLCLAIKSELAKHGHDAQLVKYPGESGLQFRFVAEAAGLGRIGTNAFLFHPQWGPWVHLRVMGTTAGLDLQLKLSGDQFCDDCGLCISECPAQAISADAFLGLQCRTYRKGRGEYDPQGPDGLLPYCKRCISICPKGMQPLSNDSKEVIIEQTHGETASG